VAETATVNKASGTYNDKNVNAATTVTATLAATDFAAGTADLSNYNLPTTVSTVVGGGTISKANLAVAMSNQTKTYDGTTAATLATGAITATGVAVGGVAETATVSKASGTYNDKNVNAATTVTASLAATDFAAGTADLSNYTVPATVSNNASTITPKQLKAIYTANDKVYNGNTNATVTGTLKDIVTGDAVTATHTSATFDTAAVGANKTVTVAGIALTGGDASNYKIDPVVNLGNTATAKANITAAASIPPAPVVPTSASSGRVKIPVGSANPFSLASVEEMDDDVCSANGIENCQCEEAQGVTICYEPAAGAGRASH
jgi:hypothetical protein